MQFKLFRFFGHFAGWIEKRAALCLVGLTALTALFLFQLPRLDVQNDLQTFYPDHERTRTFEKISNWFGGDSFARTLFIRFAPNAGYRVISPEAVVEMEAVQNALGELPDVVRVEGFPDLVKLIRSGLHGGDPSFASLPVNGDPLGYSFADVVQLTTQRLTSVNDFLSPRGNALMVARLTDFADIVRVAEHAGSLLKPINDSALATRIELMSYGAAIGEFNQTTESDIGGLLPWTLGLLTLLLLWLLRLPPAAWWAGGALAATLGTLVWSVFMSGFVWWLSLAITLALSAIALWRALTQMSLTPGTRLKALIALGVGLGGTGLALSWSAALGLLAFLLIALSVRWLWEIYLPLAVVVVATVWTFGLAAMLGVTLSFLMIAVIPLLFGVGLDDALHLLIRLRQEAQHQPDRAEAFRSGLAHTGRTLWYTTLSSIAGFGALWLSGSPPLRAFGALATLAMLSAFVVTITFIPAAYRFLSSLNGQRHKVLSIPALQPLLRPRWAGLWLAMVAGVGVIAFAGSQQLNVFPYDLRWLLPPNSPQAALYGQINEEFKNYDQVQLLLEGDIARLDVMRALTQSLNPALSASPYVRQVQHLGRLLDDVRFSDAQAEERFLNEFAQSPDAAYGNLIADAMGQTPLQSRVRSLVRRNPQGQYDATVVRVSVVRQHQPDEVSKMSADIEQRLQPVIQELQALGLKVSLSGSPFLEALSLTALGQGFYESMAWAFLLVGLVMVVLFRSLWWSLICLAPIALVMALELAAIHWLGVRISAATALVAALGIGLGVDYTIHLAQRFRENGHLAQAIEAVSPALLAATGTTAVAFFSLLLGRIPWNQDFGLLSSIAVILALVVTLWVFPSLLALAAPWLTSTASPDFKTETQRSAS